MIINFEMCLEWNEPEEKRIIGKNDLKIKTFLRRWHEAGKKNKKAIVMKAGKGRNNLTARSNIRQRIY